MLAAMSAVGTANADGVSFPAVIDEVSATWTPTPWKPVEAEYTDGMYVGRYSLDLDSGRTARSPHRPLLHGSTLYQVSEYHALITLLFAVYNQHDEALAKAAEMPFAEVRRRFLLATLRVQLMKPVFDNEVTVRTAIEKVTDKWERHRMLFIDLTSDIADGSHRCALSVCVNARDDLIGT